MENLARASRDFRKTLVIMAVFSLFANLLQLTLPLYMLQIYDRVLPSQSSDTLIFISILAALALVVFGLTEMVRQILATRASARLDEVLSGDVMERVIRRGHLTNGNTKPMRDLQAVRSLISSKAVFGVIDLPFASIFIAFLYLIHPDLLWLTLAGAFLLVVIAILNQLFSSKTAKEQAVRSQVANQQSEFFARNSDSIIAMGMLKNVIASWGKWNSGSLVSADKSSNVNSVFSGLSRTFRLGLQAAVLGYGAWLVQNGEMTAGMIFASTIISGRALQPIDAVIGSWRQLNSGWQSWKDITDFMEVSAPRKEYTAIEEPKGHLGVEGVFQPNPADPMKAPLLNRVSFALNAGESVAVIGQSGSGKSTLARIIVGALKAVAGNVRIDGHDIENWDPEDLGRHVGYLAQDVELLPGTISQNISRFIPDSKDEDVHMAAKLAHVDDLIKQMPQGFDTVIGPNGLNISGGEKQRIALARAFFGMPRILVLDEPNSSLDRIGENALLHALVAAKKNGITVLLITQREMVLQVVDKIMRMQAGNILDFDDRETVIKKYAQAAKEQAVKAPESKGKDT